MMCKFIYVSLSIHSDLDVFVVMMDYVIEVT